jgi:hypothetical protein
LNEIRRTSKILEQTSGNLQKLIARAKSFAEMQVIINDFLGAEIKIGSITKQSIHLLVTSAALATQIRYRQRDLLEFLHKSNPTSKLQQVKISVRPESDQSHESDETSVEARLLSSESKSLITATAEGIDDNDLKRALQRFADNH